MTTMKLGICIIGMPCSGKSLGAMHLQKHIGGDIIRGKDVSPPHTLVYERTRSLIPDNTFLPQLKKLIVGNSNNLLLLEGVPRTALQVVELQQWCHEEGRTLHLIELSTERGVALDRAHYRWICNHCSESYHFLSKPSKQVGRCDRCDHVLMRQDKDEDSILMSGIDLYLKQKSNMLQSWSHPERHHVYSPVEDFHEAFLGLLQLVQNNIIQPALQSV